MISTIKWVPKNKLNPNPLMYENAPQNQIANEQENDEIEMETTIEETEKQKNLNKLIESLPKDLRMDEYSSEEEEDEKLGDLLIANDIDVSDTHRLMDVKVDKFNDDDDDDSDEDDNLDDIPDTREYDFSLNAIEGLQSMNLGGNNETEEYDDDDEDNNSEYEDLKLVPSDAIVLVGKTRGEKSSSIGGVSGDDVDDDLPSIEVNVYDTKTGNLYLHHDISLPSFPLCMCYGDYGLNDSSEYNNYIAVGMFSPGIEIWNLDVINPLEPTLILGGDAPTTGKKKRLAKLHEGSHIDAVLSLSWNAQYRNVLSSGSADQTIKLWDINSTTPSSPVTTFSHHTDKVSCVEWHASECTMLASASYDRTVCLLDARSSNSNYKLVAKGLESDVECIAWDPFCDYVLTVLEEDGKIDSYDIRMIGDKKKSLYWSFVANEMGGVTDISYNSVIPGMLAASSINQTVTIYDVQSYNNSKQLPPPCFQKDMNVGKLFTLNFYPSLPWLIGCGGSKNDIALWNLDSDAIIMKHFQDRLSASSGGTVGTNVEQENRDSSLFYPKKVVQEDDKVLNKKKGNKKKGKSKRKAHKVQA